MSPRTCWRGPNNRPARNQKDLLSFALSPIRSNLSTVARHTQSGASQGGFRKECQSYSIHLPCCWRAERMPQNSRVLPECSLRGVNRSFPSLSTLHGIDSNDAKGGHRSSSFGSHRTTGVLVSYWRRASRAKPQVTSWIEIKKLFASVLLIFSFFLWL